MNRRALLASLALAALAPARAMAREPLYVNEHYDPRADPYQDLERAVARAGVESKRVLIVVGGDWCTWCDILDLYLQRDAEVRTAFGEAFVIIKVNWSRLNENTAFLSGFPASSGYPDFFILERDGAFLAQQPTDVLEEGRSYNRERMLSFARRWRRSY